MTTILQEFTWAKERAKLIQYLRSGPADDGLVEAIFLAAVQVAHDFVGRRDFTEPPIATTEWTAGIGSSSDDSEVLASSDVPAPIRVGIYEYVRAVMILRRRDPGVVSTDMGGLSQQIDLWAARNQGDLPLAVARGYWYPYLLNGTLAGGVPKL